MGEEIAISLRNVSKCFKRYAHPRDRLKELLLPGKSCSDEFWALQDINLEFAKGKTIGIVGRNGSGKSTMLQIIAGTLTPTTGEVFVKGRISALLELGSGFNPEFTGRQNVFFNGRLLGLTQKEIEDKFDQIVGFADIGDFVDQPVKTYSSGMFVRLAFAVAVNVDPEILIVDEALSVGDVVFQHRSMRRMRALMDSGVTTLFVSHDSGAIKTLCNSAVMINQGKVHAIGTPNDVILKYMKLVTEEELGTASAEEQMRTGSEKNEKASTQQKMLSSSLVKVKPTRRGNRKALIENIQMLNQAGENIGETPLFGFDELVTILVEIQIYEQLQGCIVGFFICDKNGNELIGSNTLEENSPISQFNPGTRFQIEFRFNLALRPGSYSLTVAGAENYTAMTFDWIDNAMVFQVLPPDTGKRITALVDLPISVKVCQETVTNLANYDESMSA